MTIFIFDRLIKLNYYVNIILLMNKTLAISTIALVAVVMVMGSIAPVMAVPIAEADGNDGKTRNNASDKACDKLAELEAQGKIPEGTWNKVCGLY